MRTSTTRPPRRPGRRVLAASAALGLALSLAACASGEGNDDETAAPPSSAAAEVAPGQEPPAPDTPATPMDQLVLSAQDAPDLGLAPISPQELTGGIDSLETLTAGLRVEPENCADFSQDAFLAQARPGAMAIQAGRSGDTSYAVAVTTVTDGVPGRDRVITDCPVMTVTVPIEGADVASVTQNTLLPLDPPEGVTDFAAVSQDSTMTMMGTEIRTGNLMITGVVRGVGVSVTATGAGGPVSDAARDTAVDVFARQVEKIRRA